MAESPRLDIPAPLAPAQSNSVTGTPLRIPYGNKEVALKLGARYRSGGIDRRARLAVTLGVSPSVSFDLKNASKQ